MPIKIPNKLPANKILTNENIFVMDETRAALQDIRPLKLVILNIMPTKIQTETQLLRMLSNTPLQIEVDWMFMSSHQSKNTSREHLTTFYKTFDEIKDNNYDGMIITGAPVEKMPFEKVNYWDEFTTILEWTRTHVFSTFYICWASQAALFHFYDIEKKLYENKITGIFEHQLNLQYQNRKILRGFDHYFDAPHSRYTCIDEEKLNRIDGLDILATNDQTGPYLIASKDGSQFFVTGHPEYDKNTLDLEYQRDKVTMDNPPLPQNYYFDNDANKEIKVRWKSHAYLLFSNWLNYYVYQETPFDLNDLQMIKNTNQENK